MFAQSEVQLILRAAAAGSMLWLAFLGSTPHAIAAGDVIPLSAANRKALSPLGEGVVGRAVPAQPITDTVKLFGLKPGEWKYQITSGANQGQTEAEILSQIPANASGTTWKRVVGKAKSRNSYRWLFQVHEDAQCASTSEAVSASCRGNKDPAGFRVL